MRITCATWNIHRAVGRDGHCNPTRVVDAIETALAPKQLDILALQEADTECPPHARIIDINRVSQITGLRYQHDQPRLRWGPESDGFLGTILWAHPRFASTHSDVIDLPGHCHRGAICVEFSDGGIPFRVLSGHFSLSQPLRIVQMRIIGQYIRRRPAMQTILLGDMNEWRPWGGFAFSKQMLGRKFEGAALPTFPTKRPLLPLDRILSDRPHAVQNPKVVRSPQSDIASDHCPLLATVVIGEQSEKRRA